MRAHSDIRTERDAVFAGFQSGRHDFSCRVFMTVLSVCSRKHCISIHPAPPARLFLSCVLAAGGKKWLNGHRMSLTGLSTGLEIPQIFYDLSYYMIFFCSLAPSPLRSRSQKSAAAAMLLRRMGAGRWGIFGNAMLATAYGRNRAQCPTGSERLRYLQKT